MKIFLRDRNPDLVAAWKELFDEFEDVNVSFGDIFEEGPHLNVEAIVSPSNSFAYFDGGIDYVYSVYFGWGIGDLVREKLWQNHYGELLVGQAEIVDMRLANFKDEKQQARVNRIPYLISAPTMRVPAVVSGTVNAFLAFRAALRIAEKNNIQSLLCPGLGTAIGKMPPDVAAVQMREAYVTYNNPRFFDVLGTAHMNHYNLLSPEAYKKSMIPHG